MAFRIFLLPLLCLALAGADRAPPQRIVSLNLCADQLLIALADRRQIAALTSLATDPAMSAEAVAARGLPTIRGSREDVLALGPDLIVASPYHRAAAGTGAAVLTLPAANSYADVIAQIRQVARAVGHPQRGEAMIRRMNADLARLPRASSGAVAAYYQRRGYVTGAGTLVDDLMRRVGLRNLATVLDRPVLSRLSVEQMVAARPDYLIVESDSRQVVDQGTEMLHHPALADIPRLQVPQAWTVCGGPSYVRAAQSLAAQLHRQKPARTPM